MFRILGNAKDIMHLLYMYLPNTFVISKMWYRFLFNWSTAGLNSEFSFPKTCSQNKSNETSLIYEVNSTSFQTFLYRHFKLSKTLVNSVCYCYTCDEMTDKFLWFQVQMHRTAAIGIHPTKAWLSLLGNFKNAIWTWGHFRRMICYKIMF